MAQNLISEFYKFYLCWHMLAYRHTYVYILCFMAARFLCHNHQANLMSNRKVIYLHIQKWQIFHYIMGL